MFTKIPECDWRPFQRLQQEALQRFYQQTLDDLAAIIQTSESDPYDRYMKVCELVLKRKKELSPNLTDLRRSVAIDQLVIMRGMGLLTDEELGVLSQETQARVRGIISIFSGESSAPPNDSPAP